VCLAGCREAARLLASTDTPVRLLARDPSKVEDLGCQGVEIVRGDLDDDTSVRAAIDGISEVILVSLAIPGAGTPSRRRRQRRPRRPRREGHQQGVG